MSQPAPFTRAQVSDPQVNAAIQDIYNKLAQLQSSIQSSVSSLQSAVTTLQAAVKKLTP